VRLSAIFRQAESSDIVVNAHKINRGEYPVISAKSRDFFLMERDNADVIIKTAIRLVRDNLPRYVHASSEDIQVLTPMRKGNLGVERLNRLMQRELNPPDETKREYTRGETTLREGDRVMQIRNNYQLPWTVENRRGPAETGEGVFNGDMGRIIEINTYASTLTVEFDGRRRAEYAFSELDQLELCYAVTIHKSQGSEYPAVILPLLHGPRMLMNRNLLYTAVTRARSCVVIIGSEAVFREMIDNRREEKRCTSLALRLKECAQA